MNGFADWTGVAGETPIQGDTLATVVALHNTVTGIDLKPMLQNDGTQPSLEAASRAYIAQRDAASGKRPIVAPGTILQLVPPVAPPPAQQEKDRAAWAAKYVEYLTCKRGLANEIPGYDQQRLDTAMAARDALWKVEYEDMV